jgi:hypothetical protein
MFALYRQQGRELFINGGARMTPQLLFRRHFGIMAFWHFGTLALWHFGTLTI